MQLHHLLMMVNYNAIFFCQGLCDQLYFKQMLRTRSRIGKTSLTPILLLCGLFIYALTSPQNYTEVGFLFFYPLYTDFTIQSLYTTGTWAWVYFITWVMHYMANKKFNNTAYKYLTGSSLYAYVSHYFFIIVIANTIIRPYQITWIPAIFLEIFLTNAVILLSYIAFITVWELIFPPKEELSPSKEEEENALMQN